MQKLYLEMRKECKATLVANKNERLEGNGWWLDSLVGEGVRPGIIRRLLHRDDRDDTNHAVITPGKLMFNTCARTDTNLLDAIVCDLRTDIRIDMVSLSSRCACGRDDEEGEESFHQKRILLYLI